MAPTNKRTARARKNHTLQFLSRKPFFVTRQTPKAPEANHSLKPANFPFRGPHTWQGLKALLGASRRLLQLISAAYGSGRQLRAPKSGKLRAPKSGKLRAPKGGKLRAPKSGKLRAPKSGKLRAPKSGKLRAPKGKELRAPKGKELRAPKGKELRAPVSYILRQNAALASHAKSAALGAKFSLSC
jgi:hypothetical protein